MGLVSGSRYHSPPKQSKTKKENIKKKEMHHMYYKWWYKLHYWHRISSTDRRQAPRNNLIGLGGPIRIIGEGSRNSCSLCENRAMSPHLEAKAESGKLEFWINIWETAPPWEVYVIEYSSLFLLEQRVASGTTTQASDFCLLSSGYARGLCDSRCLIHLRVAITGPAFSSPCSWRTQNAFIFVQLAAFQEYFRQ